MIKFTSAMAIAALIAAPQLYAEAVTKSGNTSGLINKTKVEAAVGTELNYYPMKADKDGKDDAKPFPFDGEWTFTWDDPAGDTVAFTGALHWGNHFTVTDAGALGGVTRQTFSDFAHNLEGTAKWDAATKTLTYQMKPKDRDDSRASKVTESKPAECDKIKGFTAGKACSAFASTSPPAEGIKLNFTFADDMSSFEGAVILTQYGGKGMTESETTVTMSLKGDLK